MNKLLTARRRIVIGCLAMAAIGYYAIRIYGLIERHVSCSSIAVRATHTCGLGIRHLTWARFGIFLMLLALIVAAAALIARWALRPFHALTAMVERLGPQNLVERGEGAEATDEHGRLTAAINNMMDRLAAGYEGQRSFAANASHELRTPLAIQRTLIEVSMSEARTPKQIALLTDQLLATNERNERLIEGLLVLSESDRGLASRTPQRLDEIVEEVVAAHADLATRANVSLSTNLHERTVAGERVLLERLVTNLVRNAITYNIEGGQVTVSVGADPALSVENTGAAIPAEEVGSLFEPFRRGTADRTHKGGGAGLGLTIVRSICHAHDGAVVAHPGAHGGLRVDVRLP
ncbi:MAG: HAMP domain-containing histidine kinase [Frankiaceae bacterium]|nr:HAMP domain-containing histidine kinase [Frankiaceae bacterium]MBV9871972.1 HAMP domain-containing histidine kinase [Frankiaceae bacterium]